MHVCMSCYEVYDDFYAKEFEFCPKAECFGGEVVPIDELMIPAIIELNKKGYYTDFCCSGHVYDVSAGGYIKFAEGISIGKNPPIGWECEIAHIDDADIIRYNFESDDKMDKYIEIMDAMESLMVWVLQLGEYDDSDITAGEREKLFEIDFKIDVYKSMGAIERVKMLEDCEFGDYKAGDIVEIFPLELARFIDEDTIFEDLFNESEIVGFMRTGDFECVQVYADEVDLSWKDGK